MPAQKPDPPGPDPPGVDTQEHSNASHPGSPWTFRILLAFGLLIGIVVAVIAGATSGWGYAIAVAILLVIAFGFVGAHRLVGLYKTRLYGDRMREIVAGQGDDPIPHLGFDDATALGDTAQQADLDTHSDMERSTGARHSSRLG